MGMGFDIGGVGSQPTSFGVDMPFGFGAQVKGRSGEINGRVYAFGEKSASDVQHDNGILQQPSADSIQSQPQGEVKPLTDRKIVSIKIQGQKPNEAVKAQEQKPNLPSVEDPPKIDSKLYTELIQANKEHKKGKAVSSVNDFVFTFNQTVKSTNPDENTLKQLREAMTQIDEIGKLKPAKNRLIELDKPIDSLPEIKEIKDKIKINRESYKKFEGGFGAIARRMFAKEEEKLRNEFTELSERLDKALNGLITDEYRELAALVKKYEKYDEEELNDTLEEAKTTCSEIVAKHPELGTHYVVLEDSRYSLSTVPPAAEDNPQVRENLAARLMEKIAGRNYPAKFKERLCQEVRDVLLTGDLTKPLTTDDPKLKQLMNVLDIPPASAGKTPANVGTMTLKFGETTNALANGLVKKAVEKFLDKVPEKIRENLSLKNIRMGSNKNGTLELSFDTPFDKNVKLEFEPELDRQTGRLNLKVLRRENLSMTMLKGATMLYKSINSILNQIDSSLKPGVIHSIKLSDLKIPGVQGIGETVAENISDIKFSEQGLQLRFGGVFDPGLGNETIAGDDKLLDVKLQPSSIMTAATQVLEKQQLATFSNAQLVTRGTDQSVNLKLSNVAIGETAKKKMGFFGKVLNFFNLTKFKQVEVSAQPKLNPQTGTLGLDSLKLNTSLVWPFSSLANWAVNKYVRPMLIKNANAFLKQIKGNEFAKVVDGSTKMRLDITDSGIGLSLRKTPKVSGVVV